MTVGTTKITKAEFYRRGGFSNPQLFRKQRNGAWSYWSKA